MKFVACVCLIAVISSVQSAKYRGPFFYKLADEAGTTPMIDQIFIGRCSDYQASHEMPHPVDCHDLWKTFSEVFANIDPCKVQTAGYDKFIQKASVPIPKDSSVFWSGTYGFTHSYVKTVGNLYTLEDVLPGYLVNSLSWCGQAAPPGINYDTCSDPKGCNENNSYDFWGKMSTWFAKSASGSIQVILNAGRDPAFAPDSFFATFELPNLQHDKVDKVEIIVVHGIDGKDIPTEKCGSGSIKQLQDLIEQYKFKWSCADNPSAIYHHLCTSTPTNFQCRNIHGIARVILLAALAAGGVLILIMAAFIIALLYGRGRAAKYQKMPENVKA